MTVLDAYREAWAHRRAVVPIFIAVRLFSFAVIAPLMALLIPMLIALSGQTALTDQAIAQFFFSPFGFVVFLAISAIVLAGSIIGFSAMTLQARQDETGGLGTLRRAVQMVGYRIPALASYAAHLVVRVLLIVLPFALLSLFAAQRLIGAYDINYYLTVRPPEFLYAAAVIGSALAVMAAILLSCLLRWAVSLHLVLFDDISPSQAFQQSAERMQGRRFSLLKNLGAWVIIRLALTGALSLVFAWLLRNAPGLLGAGFRATLAVSFGLAILWSIAGLVLGAVYLGALARILQGYHHGKMRRAQLPDNGSATLTPRRILVGTVVLLMVSAFGSAVLVDRVGTVDDVEIIAHRGAAGARPENTIAAVRKAVELGADWVEIDVQETADGQVVVMHDSDFMKLSGVDLKIWDATIQDLSDIDIGSWFDPQYSDERTPLLAEVLELVRDKSGLLIELKYYGHDVDLERRTIEIVEKAGMADQVATMSLKYPAVQKMKSLRPDWSSGVLAATAIGDLARLEADFIAVNAGLAGPRMVRSARANGKKLYVWTINDPFQMSAMMSLGVDGLITDEPGLARQVIDFRAQLTAPERLFVLLLERLGMTAPTEGYRDDSP